MVAGETLGLWMEQSLPRADIPVGVWNNIAHSSQA
jgi:hypothetical protein